MQRDGARYFGPFTDASSVRQTLDTINRLFPHILCTRVITGNDPRACLYYHIKRCPAPCIGAIDNQNYRQIIDQMVAFLDGKSDSVLKDLRQEMEEAAESLEFERAADLRDRIKAAERVVTQQIVLSISDEDVIGVHHEGPYSCVQVFVVRGGRLIGKEHFVLEGHGDDTEAEIVWPRDQYYSQARTFLTSWCCQTTWNMDAISVWLTDRRAEQGKRARRVRVGSAKGGEKRKLVELAKNNAREVLANLQQQWLADEARTTGAVVELQELLDLPQLPDRIECYDISHVQGTNQVGSMVVFENGQPRRSAYRRFKIKHEAGNNDVLSMQEVLGRRFRRALTGQLRRSPEQGAWEEPAEDGEPDGETSESKWAEMPELVIIDGGKGQLNAALEVLDGMDITELPVVGLAKENEEIYARDRATGRASVVGVPATHVSLDALVQRIRDEAHRFAITYHRGARGTGLRSALDDGGHRPKRNASCCAVWVGEGARRDNEELAAVPHDAEAGADARRPWPQAR
jgi:excinuclease ABC subunit C